MSAPLHIFVVAGEESGDALGAALMSAVRAEAGEGVSFSGVGGERMAAAGLVSIFPMRDIAVMGVSAVIGRLPTILKRIRETAEAVAAADPDVLAIIDSPDFTHRVARRVRAARPDIPIVDYVSPSVWAWRPGRAKAMAAYVDELMAILPFEPEVHRRLGGPPTHYVGHPLIERQELMVETGVRAPLMAGEPVQLVVLPGSRMSEVSRLMQTFGETLRLLVEQRLRIAVDLPAVAHLRDEIEARARSWPVAPRIVVGEAEKFAAFRRAHAALAASGTVTLELALAGVPMVVAYKLDWFFRRVNDLQRVFPVVKARSMVLANLILENNAIPERLEQAATPAQLAADLAPLLANTQERRQQVDALGDMRRAMELEGGEKPSAAAARIVLAAARGRSQRRMSIGV
jgi:lipid-A-disaccharide synthase